MIITHICENGNTFSAKSFLQIAPHTAKNPGSRSCRDFLRLAYSRLPGAALLVVEVHTGNGGAGDNHEDHGNEDHITGLGVGLIGLLVGGALGVGVGDHHVDVDFALLAELVGVGDGVILLGVVDKVSDPVALGHVHAVILDAVAGLGGVVVLDNGLDLVQSDLAVQSDALGNVDGLGGIVDLVVLEDVQVNLVGELVVGSGGVLLEVSVEVYVALDDELGNLSAGVEVTLVVNLPALEGVAGLVIGLALSVGNLLAVNAAAAGHVVGGNGLAVGAVEGHSDSVALGSAAALGLQGDGQGVAGIDCGGQGQVVALYNYMAQMIVELIKLASLIITLNKSAACAGRVADILKVKSTMDYPSSSTYSAQISKDLATATADASLSENAIVFNDVTFEYSKAGAPSLSHISFSVKKGQTVGIIGGTGSGKTTLVNLISRFYDASKGTVLLDGQNIENYTRSDLRSRIGVVPQKAALFKGSIRDNLKWGREDASDEDLWQALTTAQGKEVVEGKPGQLDFMLEQNGKNLSGGQKQRLTIARALVKKPEILILDDSASALDFATDAALRKSLNRLDWKVTTFLVSQRSSSIQQADLILVLDNGTLAGKGTHAELLRTCDTYREIYFSQFPEERARYSSVSAGNIMKEVTV